MIKNPDGSFTDFVKMKPATAQDGWQDSLLRSETLSETDVVLLLKCLSYLDDTKAPTKLSPGRPVLRTMRETPREHVSGESDV